MKAQTCPVCGGQGTVSKPPHIDGDVHEWDDGGTGGYTCRVCGGSGIIMVPED